MDLYEIIGQNIKGARKEQGIGQKVLASTLGYTPSTISQYENGKRCILLTDLEQIAITLNRPLTYFIIAGERTRGEKRNGIYISFKQYKMMQTANKLNKQFKNSKKELEKEKIKTKKLENKIQSLMTCIAEQAKITNQTTMLYNELKRNEEKIRETEIIISAYKTAEKIAYQLNNPLTILRGFIQILIRENDKNDQVGTDLATLEKNTKRCIKVIGELLNSLSQEKMQKVKFCDFLNDK